MKSETLTVRLPTGTRERISKLATATHRSQTFVVDMAIQEYLQTHEWQVLETVQAIQLADSKDAKFKNHADLKAKWEKHLEG